MKTVRVLFALAAIAIASVSVYASSLATVYYRSSIIYTSLPTGTIPAVCAVEVNENCPAPTGDVCELEIDATHFYIVSKKIDGGNCTVARREP